MPTLLGVMLLLIGCSGIGVAAFVRLERRVKILTEFSSLASRLECEIGFRLTPLAELPKRLPSLKTFWGAMNFKAHGEESFNEAWQRAAENLDVSAIDRALICEMGEILGRYDADSQAKSLDTLRRQLEISVTDAKEKRRTHGRLYAATGLLGGLILAILLV